jgi:hypothetical protein
LLFFAAIAVVLFGCRSWSTVSFSPAAPAAPLPAATATLVPLVPAVSPTPIGSGIAPLPNQALGGPVELAGPVVLGDPAGCLPAGAQAELGSAHAMLDYADQLIPLDRSLAGRLERGAWNAYEQAYDYSQAVALSIAVEDVKNEYLIQRMLNALHVAGFVAWLRGSDRPEQDLHILAVALREPAWRESAWAPYIEAFWQAPLATPPGDALVRPALKLSPCAWMVSGGFAPPVDAGWWAYGTAGWPDYARAAAAYLAASTGQANQVARQIDWLGSQLEAANTMCGPLSWSILNDAGAFPPGMGGWLAGAKVFWLAKPTTNGRPWSIFPPGAYQVHHFDEPLASFDFDAWPLYPGDFLYTYSEKDGFDHMLVVTEVHPDGSVYTVTNLVDVQAQQVTIERALLLHRYDPAAGLVRNEWRNRAKGRTGHAGFDVFRWDWMEKDILGQAVDYTVQPGDTLGLVGLRWRTPADLIARYNGLAPGATLSAGQTLRIPPNPLP